MVSFEGNRQGHQRYVLLTPVDIRLSGGALRAGPQQGELDRQTLGQYVDGGHLRPVHSEQRSHIVRIDDIGRHDGEKGRFIVGQRIPAMHMVRYPTRPAPSSLTR